MAELTLEETLWLVAGLISFVLLLGAIYPYMIAYFRVHDFVVLEAHAYLNETAGTVSIYIIVQNSGSVTIERFAAYVNASGPYECDRALPPSEQVELAFDVPFSALGTSVEAGDKIYVELHAIFSDGKQVVRTLRLVIEA